MDLGTNYVFYWNKVANPFPSTTNNTWNSYIIRRAGSNLTLWYNGNMINWSTITDLQNAPSGNVVLGRYYTDIDNYYAQEGEDLFGVWNRSLTDGEIGQLYNQGLGLNYPFSETITIAPILVSPASLSTIFASGVSFLANYQNGSSGSINNATWNNATYYVWFSNGTLFNQTNINLGNLQVTNSSLFIGNFPIGNFSWNVQGFYANSTESNSSFAANGNFTFSTVSEIVNSVTYNSSAYETSAQSFIINITTDGYAPSNYSLNYAGKSYAASLIGGGSNSYNISAAIDMPLGASQNNFYFTWHNSNQINSAIYQQNISTISLAYCTGGSPYINFSFEDELNQTVLNSTIPISTFNYWLGGGSVYKTISYSNSTQNFDYDFCFFPANQTINMNYSISYNAPSYATRTIINNNLFTSSITNLSLYLLQVGSGQIITFQVVNSATQPLLGVEGVATKIINGNSTIIGSGISGADGGISFFVDPLTQYTFVFSLAGYNSLTETIYPTQTGYTITLGGTQQSSTDYTRGVLYSINPPIITLSNGTSYLFNYTISSTYYALNNFSFNLYGSNGTLIASNTSAIGTGGTISANASTLNYSSITMNYFYYANNTLVNSTLTWDIFNNAGTSFSIANFFTDFTADINSGIFGMTPFAAAIIIYLIIFLVTGFISWKFSLTSPAVSMGILTTLVILFDVVLGFDSFLDPIWAVPYAPSILLTLMTIGFIIRESTR